MEIPPNVGDDPHHRFFNPCCALRCLGLTALRCKMAAYQSNGARLGWLLIPHERAVEVWSASGASQRLEQIEQLQAGPEFPGLQLQLAEIWAG